MVKQSFQVTVEFLGNINNLQSKLKELSVEMGKIGPLGGNTQVQKQFDQLAQTIQNLQTKAKQPITSQGEFNKLIQEVNKAEGSYNNLIGTVERLYGLSDSKKLELISKSEQARIKSAEDAIKKYTNVTEKAGQKSREFKDILSQIANQKGIKKTAEAEMSSYTAQLEEARSKLKELQQQETELATQLAQARVNRDSVRSTSGKESEEYKQAANVVSELVAKQKALKGQIDAANNSVKTLGDSFRSASERATTAAETIKQLNANKKELNSSELTQLQTAFDQLKTKAKELGVNLQGINDISNVDTLIQRMQQLKGEGLEQADMAIEKMANSVNNLLNPALQRLKESARNNTDAFEAFNRAQGDLESLKSRVGYFFSMTNSLMLLRRALTSALNTVKELDAVMTETAVVTDFTVGDMWEKLPEYSKQASALGASIKDLYSATTLYYQQGLNTEAAMGVGIETMKMARIANMEAVDATQAMTAALRGFNMEVNEINATKVNDVYSELAAITAADTNQIATAMGKTASIAASANMEFETTAALLAQIIETTQEAPETAGTAMKTIIARFTEVKELFSEGMLTGEDEEGEEININKIDAALKTVGISLKDFLTGSKGIDDIFLELASKWDGLDLATQRYIATMAAGSRQQSRFIAMMSNYERTMELVTAANDSAGASQQQFDKTLDSMEAKLQKLSNAWQEFTMGLANNEILKFGADTLTFLLKTINKVIEAVSGGNGLTKSFLTLQIAIAALSGARALLNKLDQSSGLKNFIKTLKDLPNVAATSGKQAGESIRDNLRSGFEGAISDARQAGVQIGQQLEQGIQEGRQLNSASLNVNPSVINNPSAQSYTIEEVKEETNKKSQVTPISEETANKTNAFKEAMKNTSAIAHRTTGILFTLAGAGVTYGASAIKAKDETNALAAGLEGAGAAASIGGSALSMLAPILSAAGVAIGPVIGIIAGLTAVIGLLSWAIKDAYNKSLEGRLEAAAKSTENARIAAEEAKTAYDELLQNKAGYNELQSTLNELTRGTNEWKKALVEANQQVLQLLETYPELVQFMSREDGQLVLEDAGWNYLENLLVNQAQNTQRLYSASQMSELSLEKEKKQAELAENTYNNLNRKSYFKEEKGLETGQNEVEEIMPQILESFQEIPDKFYAEDSKSYKEFVEEYKAAEKAGNIEAMNSLKEIWNNSQYATTKGEITKVDTTNERFNHGGTFTSFDEDLENLNIYNEELIALAEETGFTAYELSSMREGLSAYDSYLQIYGQKLQVYAENLLSYLDEHYQNSQYSQQVTTGLAKNFASRSATEIEEKKNSLLAEDENGNKANIQNLAKQLNESGNYKIVDTTGSDKTYQEIYEQLTGASAEGLSVDVLANEISKIMVSEELSDSAQELIGRLDKLATRDEGAANQAAALISQDVGGLNLGEISSLKEVNLKDVAIQLGYDDIGQLAEGQEYKDKKIVELDEIDQLAAAQAYYNQQKDNLGFKNVDEALSYMQENEVIVTAGLQLQIDTKQFQDDLEVQREDITKGIDSIFEDGYTEKNLSEISVQNLKNLTNQIAGMGKENGKEYVVQFQEIIAKSNLGEEQADQLATYLSNIDWSDMNEAVAAMDYMRNMGLDPSQIKNFWNVAVGGANTYISSLEEALALTETFGNKTKRVGEIEEALAEGKATDADMLELINAGVDISNFQLTQDGWKATAEQIENATDKLRQYNAENSSAAAEQQRAVWEEEKSSISKKGLIYNEETDGFSIGNNFKGIGKVTTVGEDGKLIAGSVGDQAELIARQLGEAAYDQTLDGSYENFVARIQQAYTDYINLLNNHKDIQIMLDKQAALDAAANYNTTDEAVANGANEEIVRATMEQEAVDNGLDANDVIAYSDSLKELGITSQKVRDQIAIDNAKMNQGAKEINDSWDEWEANLSQINTSDYSKALEELKASTNKLLNINDDLSDSFYKNAQNQKLIKEAAKGNTQALNELQKTAAKEIFSSLGEDSKLSAEYLDKLISTISDTSMAVGEVATLGDAISSNDIAYQLSMMYSDAYYAARKGGKLVEEAIAMANQAIAAQGFEAPEMVEKEVTVTGDLPDGWTPGPDGNTMLGPDGQPLEGVTWKQNESGTYTYTQTMLVPKTKDSGFTKTQETIGGGSRGKSSGGGGGGGGGGSKKKWENPYDEFYNVVEDINEALRQREKLERRYQALLDKTGTKASDLVKNARDQLKSLETEKKMREGLLNGRKRQMSDIESEYGDLSKYAWYNEQDGTIEIDWEKINKLDGSTNEKLTSRIEEYISKLEEQQDLIEQEEDELAAIEEAVREIREQGKDEYFDFEEQIKDALINERQQEIDKLSAINDSINDTNSRLIDAMQSSIDKYRQDRENERTEEELSDKQRRLAYLQQDTSGANALEIMQLQEEIDQGMEDYTDQLIDQKINELQEQNDKAAEQREKQIAIAEAQLKKWEESGEIWNNVYELMSSGIDEDGIVPGSELQNLLKEAANFEGMSKLQKMDWLEELENNVGMAIQWLMVGNSTEALISKGELSKGQQITFTTSDGDEVTGTLQDNGDVIDSQGNVYTDVYRDQEGNWVTEEKTKKAESEGETPTGGTENEEDTSNQQQTKYPYGKASEVSGEVKYGDKGKKVKAVQWALKKLGYSIGSSGVDGIFGNDTLKAVKKFQRNSKISADGIVGKNTKKAFKLKQYASGGLADFTGPAWLDGTKSKPEYILNAEQTKSFFELVDVLSGLNGIGQNSQITGDSIYDVDINVESIGSDYDVEQLAQTVKRMINDDARYRNNNAINLSR